MSEYYAIQRSDAWLAHYGVKGMKWGVRRALKKGDVRALRKHYLKAMKKINKLNKMSVSGRKYGARAAAYGAGAAALGGAAIGGPAALASLITRRANAVAGTVKYSNKVGKPATAFDAQKLQQVQKMKNAAKGVSDFGSSKNIALTAQKKANSTWNKVSGKNKEAIKILQDNNAIVSRAGSKPNKPHAVGPEQFIAEKTKAADIQKVRERRAISNNNLIRLGLGAAAVGMGAAAARNAYKARHGEKYRQKAIAFQREVDNTFGGIDYSKVKSRRRKHK